MHNNSIYWRWKTTLVSLTTPTPSHLSLEQLMWALFRRTYSWPNMKVRVPKSPNRNAQKFLSHLEEKGNLENKCLWMLRIFSLTLFMLSLCRKIKVLRDLCRQKSPVTNKRRTRPFSQNKSWLGILVLAFPQLRESRLSLLPPSFHINLKQLISFSEVSFPCFVCQKFVFKREKERKKLPLV